MDQFKCMKFVCKGSAKNEGQIPCVPCELKLELSQAGIPKKCPYNYEHTEWKIMSEEKEEA